MRATREEGFKGHLGIAWEAPPGQCSIGVCTGEKKKGGKEE